MALQNPLLPVSNPSTQAMPAPAADTLTGADIQRLRQSLDSSVSDNTRKIYASAWRSFQTWAHTRGALAMPASTALVAAYLTHLAEERRVSVATIRLHKAAIAALHKAAGQQDPTDNEGVKRVMHGISRSHGKAQRQAKPLTAEALAAVKATAKSRRPVRHDGSRRESAEKASLRGRVDVALLSILRDGLMRRSEAAALTWADVELRDNGTAPPAGETVQDRPRGRGNSPLHRQGSRGGPASHPTCRGNARPEGAGLRAILQAGRPESTGSSKGCRSRRGVHRPQRARRHGPGPGQERSGASGPNDRWPVEERPDAGPLHRAPGGGPRRSCQVLPGERGLNPSSGRTPEETKHEVNGTIRKPASQL